MIHQEMKSGLFITDPNASLQLNVGDYPTSEAPPCLRMFVDLRMCRLEVKFTFENILMYLNSNVSSINVSLFAIIAVIYIEFCIK